MLLEKLFGYCAGSVEHLIHAIYILCEQFAYKLVKQTVLVRMVRRVIQQQTLNLPQFENSNYRCDSG